MNQNTSNHWQAFILGNKLRFLKTNTLHVGADAACPLQKEVSITVRGFKWTVVKLITSWLRECFPVTDWFPYIFQSTFTFIISVMVSTGSEAGVKNFPVFTKVSGRAENVTHTSVFQPNAPSSTSHCPSTKCLICHFYINESYCIW